MNSCQGTCNLAAAKDLLSVGSTTLKVCPHIIHQKDLFGPASSPCAGTQVKGKARPARHIKSGHVEYGIKLMCTVYRDCIQAPPNDRRSLSSNLWEPFCRTLCDAMKNMSLESPGIAAKNAFSECNM